MILSIITINLNNMVGLKRTLDSVNSQTYKNFEYIVIDGNSNDGSQNIIKQYSTDIDYYICEKDDGIYDAMNKGIKIASGKYILFLNSGDYLHEQNTIEKVINHLDNYDIIYGDLIFKNEIEEQRYYFPKELTFNFLFNHSLPHPASFIKKELFLKYGLYNTNYKIISDWIFFIDVIVTHNATTKHIDQIISNFNLDGISSDPINQIQMQRDRTEILKNKFSLFYYDYEKIQHTENELKKIKSSKGFKFLKALGVKKFQ